MLLPYGFMAVLLTEPNTLSDCMHLQCFRHQSLILLIADLVFDLLAPNSGL